MVKQRRIAYLAPEFPGQTHAFFWREIRYLDSLVQDVIVYSTKKPISRLSIHDWSEEASNRTRYILPIRLSEILGVLYFLVCGRGLFRTAKCWWIALFSDSDMSLSERVRLCSMVVPAAKLASDMRGKGADHLHVMSCANSANLAMFAHFLSGIPYSLSLLGPTLELYGSNQKNKWRYAAFCFVMSDLLYKVVHERLKGCLPEIVEVVPVGVNLDEIRRTDAYKPWVPGEVCEIYCCGRLNHIKRHDILIDAVVLLREKGIDCRLSISGEDEQGGKGYRSNLEAHIDARNAKEFVTLLGATSEFEHRRHLSQAHVFALTSSNEGISVAIMEAMAMQVPVVVTDVGGNSELVESDVNGLLVPPGDAEAVAQGIERILLDLEFAIQLSRASREIVERKFDARLGAETLVRRIYANQVDSLEKDK